MHLARLLWLAVACAAGCCALPTDVLRDEGAHLPRMNPATAPTEKSMQGLSQLALEAALRDANCGDCSGHGDCVNNRCVCDQGHMGTFCETAVCLRNCGHHGFCDEGICRCSPGWSGNDCLTDTCPQHCSGHGVCFNGTCACGAGWQGSSCATPTKPPPTLAPIPQVGAPRILALTNTSVVVRFAQRLNEYSSAFVLANITAKVNKDCAAANHYEGSQFFEAERHLTADVCGDFVIDKAPQFCTEIELSASYGNGTFFTGKFKPATPSSRDVPAAPAPLGDQNANAACANNCSNHGVCVNGECQCFEQWTGPCCCRPPPVEATTRKSVDPLQSEPGYPPFGGPPPLTSDVQDTHNSVDSILMQDERFFKPAAVGTDALMLLELWTEDDLVCCG